MGHVLRPPIPEPQCWPPLSWHSRKHPIPRLLAPFGKKPAVAAQCIFLDPISGLAVLESPRYSEYRGHEEGKAFEALMASVSPLRVSDVASSSKRNDEESDEWHEWREATVWLRLRTGEPLICTATYLKETPHENLLISENIPYGSSSKFPHGSPIIVTDDSVIGVLTRETRGARLTEHLPGWLMRELRRRR